MPGRRRLPQDAADALDLVAELTERMSNGDADAGEHLPGALDQLARVAAKPLRGWADAYKGFDVANYDQIIAENVRALRDEANLTQVQVAEAMSRLGFDWKRVTVTLIETLGRRISLEETCALAALFAVPVLELLWPRDDVHLELFDDGPQIDPETLRAVLVGRGGHKGAGGLGWKAAAGLVGRAIAKDDVRPAAALWARRNADEQPHN